ncbi:hypothetical protein [Helicobacter sp. MIT 01-3238]|uniref:hypothetical protein n=1 Tax=Helicobacter sp. MIT 01-3238 TaxID=398627 RepID=UPI0015F1B24F|nr:hypothetical protein [Helicobacter sp. MIT 01-3238]
MTGKNPPPLSPSAEGGGILKITTRKGGGKRATTPQGRGDSLRLLLPARRGEY